MLGKEDPGAVQGHKGFGDLDYEDGARRGGGGTEHP